MRVFKGILVSSIIGLIVFLSVSCSSGSATPTAATQQVTVQKGNIALTVTGTGNLAMSNTQDLSFSMAGTVQTVAVVVSDSVKKGQVLATLDTTDRDSQVTALQKSLTAAQRNVVTMQDNVSKTQRAVTAAQRTVVEKQAAVTQAQLAVSQAQLGEQSAQDAINQIAAAKPAQDAITADQNKISNAQANYQEAAVSGDAGGMTYWTQQIKTYQTALAQDQTTLKDIQSGNSVNLANNVNLQIQQLEFNSQQAHLNTQQKQMALEDAQTAVDDANFAVNQANTALTNAQQDETDAEQNVKDIQSNITDTQNQDPTVIAPFDGIVTAVKAVGGAQIQKGSVAVSIADPTQFAVNFYVTETDIMSVKIGGDASVAVDAMSGLSFPAKVTAIAPLATIQQGVVNYKVTAQLSSLRPTSSFTQGSSTSGFSGTLPTNLPSGSPVTVTPRSGNPITITPGASFTPPANFTPGAVSANATGNSGAFSRAAGATQNVTLKDGLSSTVTITIQQATGVLIVPSRAISRVAGKGSTVQLLQNNAAVEQTVTVGLSDSTNTEITKGLNEGDVVLVKTSTTASTTNTNRLPGVGGGAVQVFRGGP
jgi:multidrug efflux pump subunit AcrA (membrane-fusion protein)